jgi:hypothetical protein
MAMAVSLPMAAETLDASPMADHQCMLGQDHRNLMAAILPMVADHQCMLGQDRRNLMAAILPMVGDPRMVGDHQYIMDPDHPNLMAPMVGDQCIMDQCHLLVVDHLLVDAPMDPLTVGTHPTARLTHPTTHLTCVRPMANHIPLNFIHLIILVTVMHLEATSPRAPNMATGLPE